MILLLFILFPGFLYSAQVVEHSNDASLKAQQFHAHYIKFLTQLSTGQRSQCPKAHLEPACDFAEEFIESKDEEIEDAQEYIDYLKGMDYAARKKYCETRDKNNIQQYLNAQLEEFHLDLADDWEHLKRSAQWAVMSHEERWQAYETYQLRHKTPIALIEKVELDE